MALWGKRANDCDGGDKNSTAIVDDEFFGRLDEDDQDDDDEGGGRSGGGYDGANDDRVEDEFGLLGSAESRARVERFRTIGYHEGFDETKDVRLQRGFQDGYQQAYDVSYRIGRMLGELTAKYKISGATRKRIRGDRAQGEQQRQQQNRKDGGKGVVDAGDCEPASRSADAEELYLQVAGLVRGHLVSAAASAGGDGHNNDDANEGNNNNVNDGTASLLTLSDLEQQIRKLVLKADK